jgi:hypothetical protein
MPPVQRFVTTGCKFVSDVNALVGSGGRDAPLSVGAPQLQAVRTGFATFPAIP